MCFHHRHHSAVASLVLEGEHHIHEIDAGGIRPHKVRKAGEIAFSNDGHAHTEGGGPDGAIVHFSFRGDHDHIYDILDENLELVRENRSRSLRSGIYGSVFYSGAAGVPCVCRRVPRAGGGLVVEHRGESLAQ